MALKVTPAEYAEKIARRGKEALPETARGVANTKEAPSAKAVIASDKLVEALTNAVKSGKWAESLESVSLKAWKKANIEKGIPNIAAGIDAAYPKVVAFATELLEYQAALQVVVHAMPDLTAEDNDARSNAWAHGMREFGRMRRARIKAEKQGEA